MLLLYNTVVRQANPKGNNMIIVKCSYCDNDLKRYPSQVNCYKNVFCNKECHDLYQRRFRETVCCTYCKKGIADRSPEKTKRSKKYHFCNRECERNFKSGKITPNEYKICGDYSIIYIKNRKHGILECKIDTEDLNKVLNYRWYASYKSDINTFYVSSEKFNKTERFILHRVVTSCPNGLQVDHINHNGLDNRKSNLIVCNQFQNQQNRKSCSASNKYSKILNVNWNSQANKWQVKMTINHKQRHFGYFDNLEEAKNVAIEMRKKYKPNSKEARL